MLSPNLHGGTSGQPMPRHPRIRCGVTAARHWPSHAPVAEANEAPWLSVSWLKELRELNHAAGIRDVAVERWRVRSGDVGMETSRW